MQGCWTAPLTSAADDGLGLFAPVQELPQVKLSETPGAAAPRRLVEAPAVVPTRGMSQTGRRSVEAEGSEHGDHRTVL